MKKAIRITTVFFLILALCAVFAACSSSPADADTNASDAAGEVTEAPTEPDNGIGTVCRWGGATLEVTEITEDLSNVLTATSKAADGKYVGVVMTITDGKMEAGLLDDSVATVKLDGYTHVDAVAQGVEIAEDGSGVYAVGTIYIIYDVPEDLDTDSAVVTVEE